MMKPYESYKKTNIPWVSEVPSHWGFSRNKNVLIEQKTIVGDKSSDYELLSLTLNGVIFRDMENAKGKFPQEFNTYKIVKKGNVIFCLFDIDETPRTVGLSKHDGMITGAYDIFNIQNINSEYLYYYYLAIDNVKAMKPIYTGLRKVIGVPAFKGAKLPVPPRSEQDQIVRFLNWKITKINKLIKAKKKQIALLNEQKQAIIDNVVTKGLDDSVPMKDSGVAWIGEIPERWEFRRNKTILIEQKEIVGEKSDEFILLSLTTNGIIPRDVSTGKGKFPAKFNTYKIVKKGDIVFCLFDIDETPRTVGISNLNGMITGAYDIFSIAGVNKDYIYYYYLSIDNGKKLKPLYTGLRKVVGVSKFLSIVSPIPSDEEQERIVLFLNEYSIKIDSAITKIQAEINLISEYKTSLISSVVTGKVDVRDVLVPDFEIEGDVVEDEIEISDDDFKISEVDE